MRTQATGHGIHGWLRSVRGRRILGLISLAAVGLAIFLASTKPDPFASTRTYYAEMDNIKGLGSIDRDIRLAGVNVGHIGEVERIDDDAVIELVMEQEIPIHDDATVRLRPHTLFEGSAFVDLSPGSPSAPALEEGGTIDREHTSTYVTLDEATRLFKEPVRRALRNLLRVASNTLQGRAIEGTQQLLEASPELTENLGPTARALQGTHRKELAHAITGLSATVREVAERGDRLGPLLEASNRTLAALEVDGGEPLARILETLPSLLERLVTGAPVVLDLIDRVDGLAEEVNPAFADLVPATAELTPVVEDAIPVLEDVTPMIADLRVVLAPLADAAPTVLRLTEELLPGNRLLVNSVLPTLDAPARGGLPAYAQLLSTFAGVDAAARTFQPHGSPGGSQGSGHFMRLGMYLDPDFFTGPLMPDCKLIAEINPDAAVALEGAGLCIPCKRVLTAPIRFLGALGQFVNPRLKAGRVPLGRSVIIVQLFIALFFVGYTLTKKSIRLPFASDPYTVQLLFAEAKGLDKYDQPAAGIAGAYAGQVTNVHYEDGRAVATLTLDPSVRGKIFADASAALRPASAIQNLLVNVDPGSPEAGPLPEGTVIPQSQTSSYVAIDELTSVLDTDTQAYVQILIDEIQRGLDGVEGDFRVALKKLGQITDSATPISRALAERRDLLTQVTDNLDEIFTTLAIRGDELGEVIDSGATTLEVTAARETELAEATRLLAPLVVEADRSLAATTSLAQELLPALDEIVPAADSLPAAAAELRGLVPIADRVFEQVAVLVEKGQYPLQLFVDGTRGINERLQAQIPVVQDLTYRAKLLDRYKEGMVQFADTWSGAFSVNDNLGPYGQVAGLKLESPRPENFGIGGASASAAGDESLNETLAIVLENVCLTEGGLACMARFATPGLEDEPVTVTPDDAGEGGS